jgi:hypothetical protein
MLVLAIAVKTSNLMSKLNKKSSYFHPQSMRHYLLVEFPDSPGRCAHDSLPKVDLQFSSLVYSRFVVLEGGGKGVMHIDSPLSGQCPCLCGGEMGWIGILDAALASPPLFCLWM